jgi:hypothetical protein
MTTWLDIKAAMVEMLEEADFTVYNNKKVSRRVDSYVIVSSGDETNNDTAGNRVGITQYRNTREAVIYCYLKKDSSNSDLDVVRESVKDEYESMLDEIKILFASVYNKAGDAGAQLIQYEKMEYEDLEGEGIYTPLRMNIYFTVEYLQDREIQN